MSGRRETIFVLALIAMAGAAPVRAQPAGDAEAQRNVCESAQYDKLVCSNEKFRAKRIQQECGTIDDPTMHQSCVASFDCGKQPAAVNPKAVPPSEKTQ
jgi:hypothetical protein